MGEAKRKALKPQKPVAVDIFGAVSTSSGIRLRR